MFTTVIEEIWAFSLESAPYLMLGFFLAGMIRAFVNEKIISRRLGGRGLKPVFTAALLGAPLPLCSCSALPTAAELRKQGASRGATTSFLISTPETGVDSVSISYAMLDLPMTIARPLAALFTAFLTGSAETILHPEKEHPAVNEATAPAPERKPLSTRLREGVRYGYLVLMADLAWYLLWGLALAGAVSAFLPAHLLSDLPGGEWTAMGLIILTGVPLYICATGSTPLAAALIAKGISPGAGLLLLLVGPATSIASLSIIWKILGVRSTVIYLTGVVVCGVLCALGMNYFYDVTGIAPMTGGVSGADTIPDWLEIASATALWLLIARGVYREKVRGWIKKIRRAAR